MSIRANPLKHRVSSYLEKIDGCSSRSFLFNTTSWFRVESYFRVMKVLTSVSQMNVSFKNQCHPEPTIVANELDNAYLGWEADYLADFLKHLNSQNVKNYCSSEI